MAPEVRELVMSVTWWGIRLGSARGWIRLGRRFARFGFAGVRMSEGNSYPNAIRRYNLETT